MIQLPKRWRGTITSTHVMAVRRTPAEGEEDAREQALETQFDDCIVDFENVIHSVEVREEER